MASGKQVETELEVDAIASRTVPELTRGIVPASATALTAAIDLGKYLAHWVVVAWSKQATGHVVDYGRLEVAGDELGLETAIRAKLREFAALMAAGWPVGSAGGTRVVPQAAFVDAGDMAPVVYSFCRSAGSGFWPSFGRGLTQQRWQWLERETQTG